MKRASWLPKFISNKQEIIIESWDKLISTALALQLSHHTAFSPAITSEVDECSKAFSSTVGTHSRVSIGTGNKMRPVIHKRQANKNQCSFYSSDIVKMTVEGHVPKLDRPCKSLPEIYETATEKINMTPQEWRAFFYLSEYPAPANQKRYLRDGIPMTFFEFEEIYGNFADSIWESAFIYEPYYD